MLIRMNLFAYLKIIFEKNPNYGCNGVSVVSKNCSDKGS